MAPTPLMGSSSSSRLPVLTGDRLSSLPNNLLHDIMSFLPVRQAVQTCVLSRRWEDLWCSMPCLSIDEQEFNTATSEARDDCGRSSESSRFGKFVNNLLMFHKATSLDIFRFHVAQCYQFEVVHRWFRRGIKCCPAVVEISRSGYGRFYGLPHLGSNAHRLRRLHLVGISLDKTCMQQLSSACPFLEDLELDKCLLNPPEISSCTLKHLIVKDYKSNCGQVLTITAPALVSFYLVSTDVQWNWYGVLVNEMPALVKATVSLKQDRRRGSTLPKVPFKLLSSLMNVRNLELSGLDTLLALRGESDTFPTFSKLRTLLFNGCDLNGDFQILGCFLNNAPILEKLTLHCCKLVEVSAKRKRDANPKMVSRKLWQGAPAFECPNLRFTEIRYGEGDFEVVCANLAGAWRNLQKGTITLTKA